MLIIPPNLDPEILFVHEQAVRAVRGMEHSESFLIDSLIAVERKLAFLPFGFSSLHAYSIGALKLSPAVAGNAVTVARKAKQVPELQEEIRKGTIGISVAKKFASVLNPGNQEVWLERAKTLDCRRLEKAVAAQNPKAATPEKAKYVSDKRLSLSLGVDEELMLRFRRAQDQVSRSKGKAASLEDTLSELVGFYLRHKDPVEKAKRVIAKKGTGKARAVAARGGAHPVAKAKTAKKSPAAQSPVTQNSAVQSSALQNPSELLKTRFTRIVNRQNHFGIRTQVTPQKRTPIPAQIKHAVRVRDQDQCQYPKLQGGICGEKRWVDLHHLKPISQGGNTRLKIYLRFAALIIRRCIGACDR